MTDDPSDRVELCQALWNLRRGIARRGNAAANQVVFGRLLTDPDYRARVIRKVQESDSAELRALADFAADCNTGALAESPVAWEAAGRTELDLEELTRRPASQQQTQRGSRWMSMTGAIGMVTLFALAGGVMSYFFSDTLNAMLSRTKTVSGEIRESTTWRSGNTYVLEDMVYVTDGTTLTIERGVRIEGQPGAALVVTARADIQAHGTREAPIVFTSAQPEGERRRGDWGGLVLLGRAPVNAADAHIEGIAPDDFRGDFGGSDANDSCGVLRFVRVEFAGHEVAANVELNGLTLGGCGRATVVRNVQVHMGLDDGVEVFGGTVNLERVLVTRAADDGLDWDLGWTGNAQFVVIQQEGEVGDNGIEADNNGDAHRALPRSAPTISNMTLVGSLQRDAAQRAMTLRRGTGADLRNLIVTGFPREIVDIRDDATTDMVAAGKLRFAGLIAHRIGPNGRDFAETELGEADDDGQLDELSVMRAGRARLGTDPQFRTAVFDLTSPDFTPVRGSPAVQGAVAVPEGEFWDEGAKFIGAVRPGKSESWLAGWTAFPAS